MKKPSLKSREWQKTQRIIRMKEERLQKMYMLAKRSNTGENDGTGSSTEESTPYKEFSINHNIDIHNGDNRQALSKICQGIRKFHGNHIHLIFKLGEIKIAPTGMLWLYAEIFRKIDEGKTKITCNYPTDKKAEQVLQHIGFFKKIGKKDRISDDEIQKADKDVYSWHVLNGNTDDEYDPEEIIHNFLEKITDPISTDISKINIAVKELIANVIYHAYDNTYVLKHWIIFGRAEEEYLTIVLIDLGKTIPVTIKEHDSIKQLIGRGDWTAHKRIMKNDSRLIEYATRVEGTTTKKKYRGKGLKEAIKNISALDGYLAIYSRGGLYRRHLSRKEKRDWEKKTKIEGTIAEITIPLSSK